jgi:cell cycle serine/threonine-protein kinase CDC5/MSD2
MPVWNRVRHPNVLFMESFFEDDEFFYIVLEICPHESLLELLAARKTLTEYEQSASSLAVLI